MTTKLQIPTENQEQKWLVKWLSLHPILKNFYCKNNNEGKRTDVQGYSLKLMGLRPGVSDLFICWPTNTYHGLWLEMKRNKMFVGQQINNTHPRKCELTHGWRKKNFLKICKVLAMLVISVMVGGMVSELSKTIFIHKKSLYS